MNDELLFAALSEAARYVRSNIDASRNSTYAAIGILGCAGLPRALSDRLIANLRAAIHWIAVEPDVAAGYCRGAAFEVRAWRERK